VLRKTHGKITPIVVERWGPEEKDCYLPMQIEWNCQRQSVNALTWSSWCFKDIFSLWLSNIAMENGPFIDGLPIKNGDFPWQTVK
jgi:hypothetical protein